MPTGPATATRTELTEILRIAWPMLIAQLAQMGTGVVDTIMAGHYGAVDLAAIAIGYNIWLPLWLFLLGLMLGATALVAQDFGAGRFQQIRDSLPQSLWLALLAGVIAVPLCYASEPLLGLLSLDPETFGKSRDYLRAVAWGMPAAALFQALRCHTQGIGLLRPFAVASVIAFLANIPLNYALIYGRLGAPELGAAGCGWATAVSMWLALLMIALYVSRTPALRSFLPPPRLVPPDAGGMGRIARVGVPIGLSFFVEVAVFSVLALLIATLGTSAVAAHQIAFNVWDVAYIPLISVGSAMATRIGHAIGAGDRASVFRALRVGAALALGVALLCLVTLLAAPQLIVSAYTEDAAIRGLAVALIRLAALFILLDAVHVTASFTLRAFKETRYPFVVTCVAFWMFMLPLGYWLGLVRAEDAAQGTAGFWRAMIAGIALSGLLISRRLLHLLARPLPGAAAVAQP